MAKSTEEFKPMSMADLLKKHDVSIYTKFRVDVELSNKFLGGWPKDPAVELAMLEARFKRGLVREDIVEAARQNVAEQASEDHEEETEKANTKAQTGFRSDDEGIYIESRQIKAGFKECAQVLGLTQTHRGVRQVMQHSFFACGTEDYDKIRFYRDGKTLRVADDVMDKDMDMVVDADGSEQLIAHVIGPQGPRSTIKFHDYILPGATFSFIIMFADPKEGRMNEKFLAYCLELAQENGFGCSRSQGFGRIKVLRIQQLQSGSLPKPKAKPTKKKAEAKKAA
jgi:hypothetical protein